MTTPASSAGGTIYDIGYRHYEGERLGRQYAIRSLLVHGLGVVWGMARGPRARLAPIVLTAVAVVPAVIQASIASYTGGEAQLIGYADYFVQVSMIYLLFCASQAPELVSADQRNRTLVLYLARALRRDDYVLAKLFALAVSVFIIALVPLLVIFMGKVFSAVDAWEAFRLEAPELAPIIGASLTIALLTSTISVALASLTGRRAYATAAIVGFFLITAVMSQILREAIGAAWDRWLLLLNPFMAIGGVANALFGVVPRPGSDFGRAGLPEWTYAAACAGFIALGAAILYARYRRIDP